MASLVPDEVEVESVRNPAACPGVRVTADLFLLFAISQFTPSLTGSFLLAHSATIFHLTSPRWTGAYLGMK